MFDVRQSDTVLLTELGIDERSGAYYPVHRMNIENSCPLSRPVSKSGLFLVTRLWRHLTKTRYATKVFTCVEAAIPVGPVTVSTIQFWLILGSISEFNLYA